MSKTEDPGEIRPGDEVVVRLLLFRQNGRPVSSPALDEPWRFTVGDRSMVDGIDALVRDMKTGETKRAPLPARVAWGQRGAKGLVAPGEDLTVEIQLDEVIRGQG